MSSISLAISVMALTISVLTFWLTKIQKGKVRMTRPTIICFLGDNGCDEPKVVIRTLLYSTAERGQYIQNMFVKIHRSETIQNFNIWAYDDNKLVRGSGLFVNKSGISSYHHFLLPKDGTKCNFMPGEYHMEVFVETVSRQPSKIFSQRLVMTNEQSIAISQNKALYYDWAPDTQKYISHIGEKDIKSALGRI